MTFDRISGKFRIKHPASKVLSSMSVGTFCRKINIGRNRKLNKIELVKEVFQWTSDVNFDTAISIFEKISPEYWEIPMLLFLSINKQNFNFVAEGILERTWLKTLVVFSEPWVKLDFSRFFSFLRQLIYSKKNPGEPQSKVYLLSGGKQFPGEPLNKGNLAAETKFGKILKEINSNAQKIPQEDHLI